MNTRIVNPADKPVRGLMATELVSGKMYRRVNDDGLWMRASCGLIKFYNSDKHEPLVWTDSQLPEIQGTFTECPEGTTVTISN